MRALVTGAAGFIGSHLVMALRSRGDDVTCLVRRPVVSRDPAIAVISADLSDLEALNRLDDRIGLVDAVFHVGAAMPDQAGFDNAAFLVTNGAATARLLTVAARLGAHHFVYLSSLSILGVPVRQPVDERHPLAPMSGYALGKLAGELACETARRSGLLTASSLRISSPYGPGAMPPTVLSRFVTRALAGETLGWYGSGGRAQDFVHVDDVVAACLLAASTAQPGVYIIASGQATTMRELAEKIAAAIPGAQARPAGRPDPEDGITWQLDLTSAQTGLRYRSQVDLNSGLARYLAYRHDPASYIPWWLPT